MSVDYFYHKILWLNILVSFKVYYYTLVCGILYLLLHHTLAYGSHLGAMIGIDDSGHNIAAECRTNLVKKVGVAFTGFGIGMVADFKRSTVGGETTVEA